MAGLMMCGPASAQLQQLPGTAVPGRKVPQPPKLPAPPAVLEWSIELPPGAEPPPSLKAEKLTLKDVRLVGVTVYRRDELESLFRPHLGKEITFDDFYGIARAIQARYRNDGYILSFAYIPPQTVESGVFTIMVVEGFVEEVRVEGVEGPLRRKVLDTLAPITRNRPLNVRDLERYLLLTNDLAGLKVTGVLRPSTRTRGATVLVAKTGHQPVAGGIGFDNRSSEYSGPWSAKANLDLNSLFSAGERLSFRADQTSRLDEKTGLGATYQRPIGDEGLMVNLSADYSISEPGFTLREFEVETRTLEAGLNLSYPIVRSRAETLSVNGGFTYRNTRVDLRNAPFNRDRLRMLRAGLDYTLNGFLGGSNSAALGVVQSVPVLNATDPETDDTSRADAGRYFTKATFDVAHARSLFPGVGLRVSATAQVARTPLPASEEFSVGGGGYGRAYNSGEVTGEDGIAVSAELSYASDWKPFGVSYFEPYGFYDFGKAWDEQTASSTGRDHSLASGGIGIRLGFPDGMTFRVEYAWPLTRTPSNLSDEKHQRLTVFAGWSY